MAAETDEDVEKYKQQVYIAEVDLNYAQYSPLAEPYISIYSTKRKKRDENEHGEEKQNDIGAEDQDMTRPPMWTEVEQAMQNGTLDKLRNRAPPLPVKPVKTTSKQAIEVEAPIQPVREMIKPTVQVDTAGLNRRERRKLLRGEEPSSRTRTRIKSMSAGFEKNMAFGAEQALADKNRSYQRVVEEDSDDGGFFE